MTKMLCNMLVQFTTTAAVVVVLTLVGFGLREATEPRMDWSGTRRERHLIGCSVCRDNGLPIAEQLRLCPEVAGLQRQLIDEVYPDAEKRPTMTVAAWRLASDPGAE